VTDTANGQAQEAPASWAQLKAQHQNMIRSTRVTMRADLVDRIDRLERALIEARAEDERVNRQALAPGLAEEIRELETEARKSEVVFAFQAMGRGAFAKLQAQHPPRPEDKELYGEETEFNPVTFPPALLAATCVEPAELRGNLAEFTEIHENWSEGQVMRIWGTCVQANAMVAHSPKSAVASEVLRQAHSESN
jgi:hypothetical protein